MQVLDPVTYSKRFPCLPPLSRTTGTPFLGAAVDTTGFSGGYALVCVYTGVLDDAVTLTGVVQESATSGGSYSSITNSGFTITTTSTTEEGLVIVGQVRLGVGGRLPFLKVQMTHAGSTNACVYAVWIECFHPDANRDITLETLRFSA